MSKIMRDIDNKNQPAEEDYNLVTACLENEAAFNRLVLKYRDVVFNLCYRLLGDYDEANDCAQETFIKVFKKLGSFKFRSSFSTWLYRIAVNTCKNNLSSLKYRISRRTVSLDTGLNPGNSSAEYSRDIIDVPDNTSDPALVYEKKEKEMLIQNAINSLNSKEKILVVLRDIEGKSYEEIAEITGIRIGTVRSALARARHELRDKLRGII